MNIEIKEIAELSWKRPEVVVLAGLPVPTGVVGIMSAWGGKGKSLLSLWMAYEFLRKYPYKKALLWYTEDPEGEIRHRAEAIKNWQKSLGVEYTVEPSVVVSAPAKLTTRVSGAAVTSEEFFSLRETFSQYDMLVLDPLLNFNGGRENDNDDARAFMEPLNRMARDEKKIVLLLHHNAKGVDGEAKTRGASDFINAARYVYDIQSTDSIGVRSIAITKSNMGLERYWAPISEYKPHQIVPPDEFWPDHKDPREYTAGHKVSFSYSNDITKDFKRTTRPFEKVADLLHSDLNYSATEYDGGYRNTENSRPGQNLMVLDYDDGLTIDEALNRFATLRAVIGTTRSHQKEKNGKTCDRFRVVLQCKPITLGAHEYKEMMREVVDVFGSDKACINIDRFYYGNPEATVYQSAGKELFDWEHYWERAQARMRREADEYSEYRATYNVNGTTDSKRKGRDTYASANLVNGARNVTLYKLAKFAERDGCSPDEIVSEIFERGLTVGLTEPELRLITREYQ